MRSPALAPVPASPEAAQTADLIGRIESAAFASYRLPDGSVKRGVRGGERSDSGPMSWWRSTIEWHWLKDVPMDGNATLPLLSSDTKRYGTSHDDFYGWHPHKLAGTKREAGIIWRDRQTRQGVLLRLEVSDKWPNGLVTLKSVEFADDDTDSLIADSIKVVDASPEQLDEYIERAGKDLDALSQHTASDVPPVDLDFTYRRL